jgi:hypothetical protein
MASVILLSADDAAHVRGMSDETPLASLQPLPLTDGRFYLGVEVLADPAHAEFHDYLSALPQVDYSEIASLVPSTPGPGSHQ